MSNYNNRYQRQPYSEYNVGNYNNNQYTDVYSQQFNKKLSVDQEPTIEYVETTKYLTVSSKDRDQNLYPNVNRYVIHFPMEFKNISSIQLIQAIIPDKKNVQKEPYLLLKIDELEDVMVSVDKNVSDAFAMILMAPPIVSNAFITMDKSVHENTIKYYSTPKASLSKMTITVTDAYGNPFDFGNDTTPIDKELQNTFVFKVTTMEKKTSSISQRNVF